MPQPARYNAYGETIAPLVDARQESLAQRPANQQAIAGLHDLLRARWPLVLRRGWHGRLVIEIIVRNGIIEQDIDIAERQACRVRE
jgi:hypothetical protein